MLNPSMMRDIDFALHAFDNVRETISHTLRSFPIDEMVKAKVEAMKQIEAMQRPQFYIEPVSYAPIQQIAPGHFVTLCLDIKAQELYEYDNYTHKAEFGEKAKQMFKVLSKVCQAEGEYVATETLRQAGSYKTVGVVYKVIEKINAKANKFVPGKLFESSEGDGYRLNPNYRVHIV